MNKKILIPIAGALLLAVGLLWFFNHRRSDISDELQQAFEGDDAGLLARSNYLDQIRAFYAERDYVEFWLLNEGLSKEGKDLLKQIEDSKYDGLLPADYNLEEIYELSADPEKKNVKFSKLSSDEKVRLE